MHLCEKILFLSAVFDDNVNILFLSYFCFCFAFLVYANECLYKFAIKNYKYNT